ncbi:MAG: sporulation protein YabP [Firmicutes bacterium]|nr:sporulation protein YabP [Bacillota bacterium]
MPEPKITANDHKLVLVNQESLEVTGVSRVESFNPEEILLETPAGLLAVKGDDLDIRTLNLEQGVVDIEGLIYEIIYTGEKGSFGKRGFFERIFK